MSISGVNPEWLKRRDKDPVGFLISHFNAQYPANQSHWFLHKNGAHGKIFVQSEAYRDFRRRGRAFFLGRLEYQCGGPPRRAIFRSSGLMFELEIQRIPTHPWDLWLLEHLENGCWKYGRCDCEICSE